MYKCPHCGGEMEFVPENGIIKCQYCGSTFSIEEDLNKTRKNAGEQSDFDGKGRVFTCSQCGASLYTEEDTGVTFCSYCGSQAFIESRMNADNMNPDLIIPFVVPKEKCQEIYRQKIKSAWFLPSKMKSEDTIDKFRGIYMPCWIYTAEGDADGRFESTKIVRQGPMDVYETYAVDANPHGVYGGFVKDAAASFPDGIMREISPFDMRNAVKFNDKYMTGFYADIGNVPPEAYSDEIIKSVDINLKDDMKKDSSITRNGVSASAISNGTNVSAKITNVQKGFFPVWFLSNKNKRTGRMSYAVINGINGNIHADLPMDFKKYLLVALIIAIPVFVILQFFTMKPETLLVIALLLLGLIMFFSTGMFKEKYIQEHSLDDEGLLYVKNNRGNANGARIGETIDVGNNKGYKVTGGSRKTLNILFGIFCFIALPVISGMASLVFERDLLIWGFGLGIALFIAVNCFKGSVLKSSDGKVIKKIKLPFYMVIRSIAMPIIGIIAGLAVLIALPASDLYFYLAVILCCIILILTVLDFVRANNRLSLRKPAQLGKRGGDEND